MAKKQRPDMQELFNEISVAPNSSELITALDKIDLLKVNDQKEILNQLEETMMDNLVEGTPSVSEIQAGMLFSELEDLSEIFFGAGMNNKQAEDDAMLEVYHEAFLVVNKIIEGKKDAAEPVLKDLMDMVSKMSDSQYNSVKTLMMSMARTVQPYKNKQTPNPFKK